MIVGTPRSYHKKFKFIVEVDGVAVARFQKAGPIEIEVAVVEQHEGGDIIPVKEPGRAKVSDLTLDRGVTGDMDLWNWMQDVINIAANGGLVLDQYKRQLDIVEQDRDGTTLNRWRCKNCWPTKGKFGEWDNDSDENVIESVTLAYDYPTPIPRTQ